MSDKELAKLFFARPVGTNPQVSPDGTKLLLDVTNQKGESEFAIFGLNKEVLNGGGLKDGGAMKASNNLQVASYYWIDNEWIGYNLLYGSTDGFGVNGYAVVSLDFRQHFPQLNTSEGYWEIKDGLPDRNGKFLAGISVGLRAGMTTSSQSYVLMEIEPHRGPKFSKVWIMPEGTKDAFFNEDGEPVIAEFSDGYYKTHWLSTNEAAFSPDGVPNYTMMKGTVEPLPLLGPIVGYYHGQNRLLARALG